MGEDATLMRHRPAGWAAEQNHVVVRRCGEGRQQELVPAYTVILVSRDDLPLDELVRRHRGKQGPAVTGRFETAFKGLLIDLDLHHAGGSAPTRHSTPADSWPSCCCAPCSIGCCRRPARHHGLRQLIRHLVRTVARLVRSGRRCLDFARTNFRVDWLYHAAVQVE